MASWTSGGYDNREAGGRPSAPMREKLVFTAGSCFFIGISVIPWRQTRQG